VGELKGYPFPDIEEAAQEDQSEESGGESSSNLTVKTRESKNGKKGGKGEPVFH